MILAVVDANVLVSAIAFKQRTSPAIILESWESRRFSLIASEVLLEEVKRTLEKPYFAAVISRERTARALASLREWATIVELNLPVRGVATHPENDLLIATAVSGDADYLVTGDIQLQKLGHHESVTIVSPAEFLRILEAEAEVGAEP